MLRFAALLLAVALAGGAGRAAAAEPTKKPVAPPSIIVLVADALRADYLGCYGFKGEISPNVDALCREGVVFEHAFSQAPWTKPSVATLFTSLPPLAHQVTTHRGQFGKPQPGGAAEEDEAESRADGKVASDVLAGSAITLAETMRQGGYATAAFVANPRIRSEVGFGQGFDAYNHIFAADADAEAVILAARAWLARRPLDRPFFLYLHLMDVHEPYDAPEEDVAAVRDSASLGSDRTLQPEQLSKDLLRSLRAANLHWADPDRPEHLQLRTWRARYAGGVRAFDRRLKTLTDFLATSGLDRDTMLVLTSDHGEELFEHAGWGNGATLCDHQLHVPLIIRPPGGLKAPRRVDGFIGLIDLAPTLAGIGGTKPPPQWKGRNFSALVRGTAKANGQDIIFASTAKGKPGLTMARTRRYKLVRDRQSSKEQLYYLPSDPQEQRDGRDRNPALAGELRIALEGYAKKAQAAALKRPAQVEIGTADAERLRELGY
ncbi:MAG TPA: sulfatase [Terriglobales bacterium]|nr:sulfatase [Terriglobales bacterium]